MTNGQSSVKMPPRPRVVVLGAGFAGLNAALALGDMAVDVTVIDRRNHHTFQPLLYQVARRRIVARPISPGPSAPFCATRRTRKF